MAWFTASMLDSSLPQHCEPANDFLLQFSSTFHTCIPTPLAFISNTLGILSIVAWLFAQLPQIYKNWRLGSTAGLSIFFLVEWCLGDLSNLLGALFTHQATWQVAIGSYYVFVDFCLVGQWIWYEALQHGHPVFRLRRASEDQRHGDGWNDGGMGEVTIQGSGDPRGPSRPRIIFREPSYRDERNEKPTPSSSSGSGSSPEIHRVGPSATFLPSPSPRTVLLIACLVALAQASPIVTPRIADHHLHAAQPPPTTLEYVGTILSWISTLLYLGSRLPQIFKNWRRKSTAGLSPHLFIAAFCGNFFYSSALLTNPCAWYDFGPYGGGGWAGAAGSDRAQWVLAALPFFLGAAGVLGMDACVGLQFWMYGEKRERIVDVDTKAGSGWHWRRVSGWMRGWVPSAADRSGAEREALIRPTRDGEVGQGYGGI